MTGRPRAVTCETGTWSAMECTFRNLVALTPGVAFSPSALAKTLRFLERPQVAQVEDGAEVDVEALGALAGENHAAVGKGVHGRACQRGLVVRGRQRADVARRAGQAAAQLVLSAAVQAGDRVGLPAVPAGAGQRRDRTGVVEERAGVGQLRPEPEPVGDVRLAVAFGVDMDVVDHVVTELVEVRAARGALQRQVVGDQRHGARLVRAHERVDVGAVGNRDPWRSPAPPDVMTWAASQGLVVTWTAGRVTGWPG